jgi:hypothetical protein
MKFVLWRARSYEEQTWACRFSDQAMSKKPLQHYRQQLYQASKLIRLLIKMGVATLEQITGQAGEDLL